MSEFIVYNNATGAIVSQGVAGDPTIQATGRSGCSSMAGVADPRTEYVDLSTTTVVPKAPATFTVDKNVVAADGVEEVQLQGIDIGDDVTVYFEDRMIGSFSYMPSDGQLTFTEDGQYKVHVRPPRKLEHEEVIDAT